MEEKKKKLTEKRKESQKEKGTRQRRKENTDSNKQRKAKFKHAIIKKNKETARIKSNLGGRQTRKRKMAKWQNRGRKS